MKFNKDIMLREGLIDDMNEMMDYEKENLSKKNSCRLHCFELIDNNEQNKRFKCTNCGYEEKSEDYVNGYNDALKHFKKVIGDIVYD